MKVGLLLVVCIFNLFLVSIAQKQCPDAPASPQDRRPDKTILKIATYNTEWLFLNRSNCPGTGCTWRTEAEARQHMAKVAAEIVVLNADIVNLAEVQDCYVLTQLNELLKGMDYLPYLLTGTDTSTGQNVALLTRVDPSVNLQRTANRVVYPIPTSSCGVSYSGDSAVSKHYFTTFDIAGLTNPLTMIGLHFLAYPDDTARCVQREAQASVIKQLVGAALEQGHSVVVLGDVNDFDGTLVDASGNVPISTVLHLLRDPLPEKPGDELANVATFVAEVSQRYSCWWDKQGDCKVTEDELSLIDHLLISQDLVPRVSKAYMDHTYGAACGSFQSDHWPVVVQLNV